MDVLLGGVPLRSLTAAQRAALSEAVGLFDVDAPEVRRLVAHITGREELRPSEQEWVEARERRERAARVLFGDLADRLDPENVKRLAAGLRRVRSSE